MDSRRGGVSDFQLIKLRSTLLVAFASGYSLDTSQKLPVSDMSRPNTLTRCSKPATSLLAIESAVTSITCYLTCDEIMFWKYDQGGMATVNRPILVSFGSLSSEILESRLENNK